VTSPPIEGGSGNRRLLALVIAATAVGPLSMNIFIPSMPGLQDAFGVSYGTAQLTLIFFMIGLAGAQLVHGPLSDRFGRRPVMIVGLLLHFAGSLFCLFAPTIQILIAARLVQAVGGCVGMVVGRAIIRDLFDRRRTASLLAYVTMAMVAAPMLAPTIGGFLDVWQGWRASFVFVLMCSILVAMATLRWLPETLTTPRPMGGLATIPRNFVNLLRQRLFCGYSFQIAFTAVTFFSFLGGAPYVTVELLGGTPSDYGLYFIPVAGSYMCANFLSARITMRIGVDRMITMGCSIILIAVTTLLTVVLTDHLTMASLFGCIAFMSFGHGFCIPNGLAGAVSTDHKLAGAAAGLSGFLQMGAGAGASFIVGHLLADSAIPMAVVIFLGGIGSMSAHVWGVLLAPER
jgi:MFS transporter, DHA1 family, multidrug resistance protein